MNSILKKIDKNMDYDDLYEIPRNLFLNKNISSLHSKNMNIALLNVPCGGFGDVIICKTFYDYLTNWYKNANVYICTNDINKFKTIKADVKNMIILKEKGDEDCHSFYNLSIKTKIKFNIMIIVPVAKRTFFIEELQSMIPYANKFNTFTTSEYNNDVLGPYTFSTGIGKHNQGIFLTDINVKKHNLIKSPYALIYIQPPGPESTGSWGVHGNYCFLSFIEMISKKYNHKLFEVIVPDWIVDIIRCYLVESQSGTCYTVNRRLKEYTKNYPNLLMIDEHKEKYVIKTGNKSDNTMIIRGDILPKPRTEFISLIKYSVDDVLLTGDQSITDAFSCCSNKTIWYQIAPWKKDFALQMSKHIPNKYFKTYKTSCGTIDAINYNPDYRKFLKKFDFRIEGKKIMDSIVLFIHYKNNELLTEFINIVNTSYGVNSVINKIKKYNMSKNQIGSGPNSIDDKIDALKLFDKYTVEKDLGNIELSKLNYQGGIKLIGRLELADTLVDRGIEKLKNKNSSAIYDFQEALILDPKYTLAQEYIDTINRNKKRATDKLYFSHQTNEKLPDDILEEISKKLDKIIKN